MIIRIKCPKCEAEGTLSLVETSYKGPYRCWKCRALFTISLQEGQLKSCRPLSEEDLQKHQEAEALKAKFKRQ
jgi:hypothetical protein